MTGAGRQQQKKKGEGRKAGMEEKKWKGEGKRERGADLVLTFPFSPLRQKKKNSKPLALEPPVTPAPAVSVKKVFAGFWNSLKRPVDDMLLWTDLATFVSPLTCGTAPSGSFTLRSTLSHPTNSLSRDNRDAEQSAPSARARDGMDPRPYQAGVLGVSR